MWIFKNNAFVSIVEDRDMPDQVWVRGRVAGDIEAFLGEICDYEVILTESADYRFRTVVHRNHAAMALFQSMDQVDYDNFKSSIEHSPFGERRHTAYVGVWQTMLRFQKDEAAIERDFPHPSYAKWPEAYHFEDVEDKETSHDAED
jgi:hypothetical protein